MADLAELGVRLEADWQASGENASRSFSNAFSFITPPPNPALPVSGVATLDYAAKITWFGTARGRVGYAWDRLMLYATGGLAYGGVKLAGTNTVRTGPWPAFRSSR